VVAAGLPQPAAGQGQVHARSDRRRGEYCSVAERAGALVGMVLVGRPDQAGVLTAAVRAGAQRGELPFDPLDPHLHWGRYAFAGALSPTPT